MYKVVYYASDEDRIGGTKTVKEVTTLEEAIELFHLYLSNHRGEVTIVHPPE